MNTFTAAVRNQSARTENGMLARKDTGSANVTLFFKIGASRGMNVIPEFVSAFVEDSDKALRIAQWCRDVRGGAGERQIFRDIMLHLEQSLGVKDSRFVALLNKTSELGRWDDLFIFTQPETKKVVYELVSNALKNGNALAAKWCNRKGQVAVELRNYMGLSPKAYRQLIVGLSKTTEQFMCKNAWSEINFAQVPSVCHARNRKAFGRHTEKYAEYIQAVKDGEQTINAGAIFPYDVLKTLVAASAYYDPDYNDKFPLSPVEIESIIQQWNALENFMGSGAILPMVDVSGSMMCAINKHGNLTALDVAISLGLYCADKNQGTFNGTFLTFSGDPELVHLKGNIVEKFMQMSQSHWGMNTDLHRALDKILLVATEGKIAQSEMPEMLLILSDMAFDQCVEHDDTAMEMIIRKYNNAGYTVPKIVFWNLHAHDNVPVKFNESGVALVSGFSPAILKSLLANDLDQFTPEAIMDATILNPKYDL